MPSIDQQIVLSLGIESNLLLEPEIVLLLEPEDQLDNDTAGRKRH